MAKKLFLFSVMLFAGALLYSQNQPGTPLVTAKFEVAGIAHGDRVPFKLSLRNMGTENVDGLSVVATAGEAMQSFPAPLLEPGEERVIEGELRIGEGDGNLEFSARVIGEHFSYRSPAIVVARPEGIGGGGQLYTQVQQQQLNAPLEMGNEIVVPATPDLAFGALEPVDKESDVKHLISRVELHECNASRQTLEFYQELGNSQADQFLAANL